MSASLPEILPRGPGGSKATSRSRPFMAVPTRMRRQAHAKLGIPPSDDATLSTADNPGRVVIRFLITPQIACQELPRK